MNITPSQALELLAQAASTFVGTRSDHAKIDTAIKVLHEALNPAPATQAPDNVVPFSEPKA